MTYPEGLSARAIAGMGENHPHDPSDLLRCVRYCDGYITTEQLQKRMAGRSIWWDRLLPEWDTLTELLAAEMRTSTNYTAPRTYQMMKRLLAAGTICDPCAGSGRGDACPKCKGTGRRCGGKCRAPGCFEGLHLCPPCRGLGYTKEERS